MVFYSTVCTMNHLLCTRSVDDVLTICHTADRKIPEM